MFETILLVMWSLPRFHPYHCPLYLLLRFPRALLQKAKSLFHVQIISLFGPLPQTNQRLKKLQ